MKKKDQMSPVFYHAFTSYGNSEKVCAVTEHTLRRWKRRATKSFNNRTVLLGAREAESLVRDILRVLENLE